MIDNATELVSDRMLPDATGAFNVLIDVADARAAPLPVVDAAHPLYSELLLWTDANRNGRSEFSELRPVSELLARIGLGMQTVTETQRRETACRFQGFSVTVADWSGRPRPNDRYHPIYEIMLGNTR